MKSIIAAGLNFFPKIETPSADSAWARLSDEELMCRIQKRQRAALTTLYERFGAKATGLAMKILGERGVAEDVVQEAFWRVWERAAQYQSARGNFTTWFLGIVRHLALDELRRRERRPWLSVDQIEESGERASNKTSLASARREPFDSFNVQAAMNSLRDEQRQVIELAFFQGYTHREIAQRLKIPLGTVHTRARLGLEKLRDLLTVGKYQLN